jgi:AcrR family transcriptional regulator
MARPRSDDKRAAILAAATRVIATEGLGAATAAIARAADVSNGSLFTYFETKADLLNQLYVELKTEMAAAAMDGLSARGDIRKQSFHMWTHRLHWATAFPHKRRTLAHLSVCDDITPASRQAGHQAMAGVAHLLEKSRENGPMRNTPLAFVVAILNAMADATMDFMIHDPAHAEKHCKTGFEALWRMIA